MVMHYLIGEKTSGKSRQETDLTGQLARVYNPTSVLKHRRGRRTHCDPVFPKEWGNLSTKKPFREGRVNFHISELKNCYIYAQAKTYLAAGQGEQCRRAGSTNVTSSLGF